MQNLDVLSSFLCSSVVQVKFSQSSVATTEEEGQVLVTVEAMGDLSSDFSIIVMAINGTAVGKLLRQSMAVQTHDLAVVCSRPHNQLNANFLHFFLSQSPLTSLGICGQLTSWLISLPLHSTFPLYKTTFLRLMRSSL